MSARHYAFQLGDIACTVLLDGVTHLGRAGILKRYPDAAEADYEQAYAHLGLSIDDADSSFNILLLEVGTEKILVDSGQGGQPYGGDLLACMQQANIQPESITRIIITHAHGDHVLGLLSDSQQPIFPNASYAISKQEMAFWRERIETQLVEQAAIVQMMEARGLRLIDMDEAIIEGLTALPIPGHTPGQIGLLVESEGRKLIHMADLLHSPMQFAHPEWSASFDVDTSVSVPTRRAALQRAADDNALALFYHLTFPGLGHVCQAASGYIWEPITL